MSLVTIFEHHFPLLKPFLVALSGAYTQTAINQALLHLRHHAIPTPLRPFHPLLSLPRFCSLNWGSCRSHASNHFMKQWRQRRRPRPESRHWVKAHLDLAHHLARDKGIHQQVPKDLQNVFSVPNTAQQNDADTTPTWKQEDEQTIPISYDAVSLSPRIARHLSAFADGSLTARRRHHNPHAEPSLPEDRLLHGFWRRCHLWRLGELSPRF